MNDLAEKKGKANHTIPWITPALVCTNVVTYLILGPAPDALVYSRQAIADGELWRLVTGHFVHCDDAHLFWNTTALAVIGTLLEQRVGRQLLAVTLMGCLGVCCWLWLGNTCLHFYCGLSGVLNALLMVLLVVLWRETGSLLPPVVFTGAVLKIVLETINEQAIFTDLSWMAVPGAHAAGLVAGLTYILTASGRPPTRLSSSN